MRSVKVLGCAVDLAIGLINNDSFGAAELKPTVVRVRAAVDAL